MEQGKLYGIGSVFGDTGSTASVVTAAFATGVVDTPLGEV